MIREARELVERVKAAVDIAEVIGRRLKLDRHNKAACPFHEDTHPSLSVHPEDQYFYCFGCGVGGDVFRFLELYERKPFEQVFAELARQKGIALPEHNTHNVRQIEQRRNVREILGAVARFYHRGLMPQAREYLTHERGLTDETISRFRIGYAHGGLRDYLIESCKFPQDACIAAGVLRQADEGVPRDFFHQRITLPNTCCGEVVHMTGRSLNGRDPKYLHLPGPIQHFYNEEALRHKEVIVTEGPFDCLSAIQAGHPAAALLGTAGFKPEHVSRFSQCKTIYLCFDADAAGWKATLRIASLLPERARAVKLPKGFDLNDYFRQYTNGDFKSLLAAAKDLVQYRLDMIPPDTPKTKLPDALEPILRDLASMKKAKAEAYLAYEIKHRFKLRKKDIDAYRGQIKAYRKEASPPSPNCGVSHDTPPVYAALFDGLVDLVQHDGRTAFLVRDGGSVSVLANVERDGVVLLPPPIEQIPWLLPRAEEVLKHHELSQASPSSVSHAGLYDDLLVYHKSISELPEEEHYDLITAWAFHTYLLEPVQYTPVLCFFAVPERGKSRTGKGMIHVAYRGIHVESLRDAYIVRVASNFRATLFFDVKDIWRKAEKHGSEDILLHRFEKGAKVPRVLYPDRGPYRDTVYYDIFGPTLIATNAGVHKILETRAIQLNMPVSSKRFDNDVKPEDGLPLKERLVAFRAWHLGATLPDIPKPVSGRLGDILRPLLQIVRLVRPNRERALLTLAGEIELGRKLENADSFEAQLLSAVIQLRGQVDRGLLPVKTITDAFNEGKLDKWQISYTRVGKCLAAMDFDKGKTHNGAAGIVWNKEKVGRMASAYGLRQPSDAPDASDASDGE